MTTQARSSLLAGAAAMVAASAITITGVVKQTADRPAGKVRARSASR